MKVATTKLEKCQAVLTVEAEPADMEKAQERAYRRLVSRNAVPGFRPGKAPRQVLERYIGKATLEREAVNMFLPEAYQQALKQAGVEAVAEPELEITQLQPLVFKAVVSLRPSVELGDYTKIRLEVTAVPVTEEDIAQALEQVRQEQATWEPVDRPVELGNLVTMDVWGGVGDEVILSQNGLQYVVRADIPFPLPGFAEQLVGMGKNEQKSFPLAVPADYPNPQMQGKTAEFQVHLVDIKGKKLAPLDDEFAKTVSFPNLEALRERVASNLTARAEGEARRRLEEAVLSALLDISHLEFPPVLVDREIDGMLRERGGNPQDTRAPAHAVMREQLRPMATERVQRALALEKLAEAEKIEVGPEEVTAEVERLAGNAQGKAAEVRKFFTAPGARQFLQNSLIARKTLARLVAMATGQAEGGPAQDRGSETNL